MTIVTESTGAVSMITKSPFFFFFSDLPMTFFPDYLLLPTKTAWWLSGWFSSFVSGRASPPPSHEVLEPHKTRTQTSCFPALPLSDLVHTHSS